jgi:photosystem II stability/assembly factor-like uncharacterized protein
MDTAMSADGSRLFATAWSGGADEYIYTSEDAGTNWMARGAAAAWGGLDCSDDGLIAFATTRGNGPLYKSTDAGTNWVAIVDSSASGYGQRVACNSNGTKVALTHSIGAGIRVSTDVGETFTGTSLTIAALGIAMSSCGQHIYVTEEDDHTGKVYGTHDFGATWPVAYPSVWLSDLRGVACSTDGSIILVAGGDGMYLSLDSGVTWRVR